MTAYPIDPKLDLVLERTIDVPVELVWKAWTEPQHLIHWFTPAPWKTVDCEIDLRPGGIFRTVMRSPEGQDMNNIGCCLEVVHHRKLVFTDALLPGFRPHDAGFFTGIVMMEPVTGGSRYTACAIHKDEAGKKAHEDMGFHSGWGTALDQLVAYVKAKM